MKFVKKLALIAGTLLVPLAQGSVVFSDNFNDNILNTNWTTRFENASGWTFEETGGSLVATDISRISNEQWARVYLEQELTLDAEFHAEMAITWNSFGSNRAMQNVYLGLLDDQNNWISGVGYNDSWVARRGGYVATVGDAFRSTGLNSLGHSGSAQFGISRIGDLFNITINDSLFYSGTSDSDISKIGIRFDYFPTNRLGGSFFGTQTVDYITVTDIPEPHALGVLGLGLLLMGVSVRRRAHQKKDTTRQRSE